MRNRKVLTFVLDKGMPGLEQANRCGRWAKHGSPTGEVFLSDVRVVATDCWAKARRPRAAAVRVPRTILVAERAGVAAMSLASSKSASSSPLITQAPSSLGTAIADFQLIQLKLAQMEVARITSEICVRPPISKLRAGAVRTLAEALAMSSTPARPPAKCRRRDPQIFGGNGYIAEYRVGATQPRRSGTAHLRRDR